MKTFSLSKCLINILIILSLFSACKQSKKTKESKQKHPLTEIVHDTIHPDTSGILAQQRLLPVLYHQRSGEYRGLCYQAFQLAKMLLMNDLRDDKVISKRAIVLDVDETVLDNSPFEARCIIDKLDYNAVWDDYCKKADATSLPGAVEFLNYARRYGVDVFYVTNRTENLRNATAENIRKAGLPLKSDEFLLMKQDGSSKEERRKQIDEHYHIALLMGDNLNDFSKVFENRSADDRVKATDSLKTQFGDRFVLLPNVIYGAWEDALYNYKKGLAPNEQIKIRYNSLRPD